MKEEIRKRAREAEENITTCDARDGYRAGAYAFTLSVASPTWVRNAVFRAHDRVGARVLDAWICYVCYWTFRKIGQYGPDVETCRITQSVGLHTGEHALRWLERGHPYTARLVNDTMKIDEFDNLELCLRAAQEIGIDRIRETLVESLRNMTPPDET